MTWNPVRLEDVCDPDDLFNETEALGRYVVENGVDILEDRFEIRRIPPEEIANLRVGDGEMRLLEAFNTHAKKWQRDLVQAKMKDFDAERVVIVADGRLIDGHHHAVAAALLGKSILAIDVEDPVLELTPGGP